MQKNETRSPTYTIHKNKLKMDTGLKHQTGNHKNTRSNHSNKISDICQKNFTDTAPRAMEAKEKINKWDSIKIKSFFTAKETINKTTRKPMVWENIFGNNTTDKGLTSNIYRQLIQLNKRKMNDPIKKWAMSLHLSFGSSVYNDLYYPQMSEVMWCFSLIDWLISLKR